MAARLDKSVAFLKAIPMIATARPRIRYIASKLRERLLSAAAPKNQLKYLRYERQIARSLYLARQLQLNKVSGQRLLDIGTGPGYFPFVCEQLGHRVTAIDVDWNPMFNELSRALSINRIVHEIRAYEPLPPISDRFDIITAFMICFNGHKERIWHRSEWDYFLDQLRALSKPGGTRVVLNFNVERDGTIMPADVTALFASLGARVTRNGHFVDFILHPVDALTDGLTSRQAIG